MSEEIQQQQNEPMNQPVTNKKSRIPNVTIINVVLLVGLLVLYVLQFFPEANLAGMEDESRQEITEMADNIEEDIFKIAYVNSDSLMAGYEFAIKLRADFEAEQRRLENNLQSRQKQWQEEVESFQRQAQLGLITRENAQVKEQELMMEQQEIVQLNDTYANRLMNKEMEMNRELYQKITNLLDRFNAEMGYDYILGFTPGGGILYAKEQHDITEEILGRLNQEYNEVE